MYWVTYAEKNESVIVDEEDKDSIEGEMLMSMKERAMPMGVRGTSSGVDSSDKGSFVGNKSQKDSMT